MIMYFSNDNVLLAGSVLKNTEEVYSCCVYSGIQTKIRKTEKKHFYNFLFYF